MLSNSCARNHQLQIEINFGCSFCWRLFNWKKNKKNTYTPIHTQNDVCQGSLWFAQAKNESALLILSFVFWVTPWWRCCFALVQSLNFLLKLDKSNATHRKTPFHIASQFDFNFLHLYVVLAIQYSPIVASFASERQAVNKGEHCLCCFELRWVLFFCCDNKTESATNTTNPQISFY